MQAITTGIERYRPVIFIILLAACLTPWIDPPIALFLGIVVAQTIGHPFLKFNKKATKLLLQYSVVGLGFGMNLYKAMEAGKQGVLFTVCSIVGVLALGYLLGKLLKIESKISYLISSGTAICGGSAIAAVSPLIQAEDKQISVALGTVFILNSISLFFFPWVGHALNLSEPQFGYWAAIAIHDTSSVVGAGTAFGPRALEIATTVKLVRALWIIPLALFTSFVFKAKGQKIQIPWFIFMFVGTMIIATLIPEIKPVGDWIVIIAKKGLTITLFLIGAGLSRAQMKAVGFKPFIQGIILWVVISVIALVVVMGTIEGM